MLLELDPTTPIDFRRGGWGHKLHANTYKDVPPLVTQERLVSFLPWPRRSVTEDPYVVRRRSFMVHSSQYPRRGREVVWKGATGDDITGVIYDIEHAPNVRDMFTLYVILKNE